MDKYCVWKDYTIKEAIEVIDASHNRVAIVLNKDNHVIGVISQGDIIRALSSGKNIFSCIDGMFRTNFLYLTSVDMDMAYKIFKKRLITLLPVVDMDFKLTDVITLDIIYEYLEGR